MNIITTAEGTDKLARALYEEGRCGHMYPDSLGLVSTGIGSLIDASKENPQAPWTPAHASDLPWHGTTADWGIDDEWKKMKDEGRKMLASGRLHPGQWFRPMARLTLTDAEVQRRFENQARTKVTGLKRWRWYRQFDSFPADAQVAIVARSWGPLLENYRFNRACCYRDWQWAQQEVDFAGLPPTRRHNLFIMLGNAATVDSSNQYDHNKIYWPTELPVTSSAAYRFRLLITQPDWAGAFRRLNGEWIYNQLRMLDSLSAEALMRLWAMKGGVKASNPSWGWARMEFAISVVWHGHLPDYSEDMETAAKLTDDDHTQAIRFLSIKGLLTAKKKR